MGAKENDNLIVCGKSSFSYEENFPLLGGEGQGEGVSSPRNNEMRSAVNAKNIAITHRLIPLIRISKFATLIKKFFLPPQGGRCGSEVLS